MNFEMRIKAIEGLAGSSTESALEVLRKEMRAARSALENETDYELLEQSLAVLEIVGRRFAKDATSAVILFISSIKSRSLTNSDELSWVAPEFNKYQNSTTLIVRAIQVLAKFRYHLNATKPILDVLLEASKDGDNEIRSSAAEGLKSLAAYNPDVFYGPDRKSGIGGGPQTYLLKLLFDLSDENLIEYLPAIIIMAEALLSPEMEGLSSTHATLTISHVAMPTDGGVVEIREGAISLLKKLYRLASDAHQQQAILIALNSGTRRYRHYVANDASSEMIKANTLAILKFYEESLVSAPLPVVQKIESLSYWIFHNAADEQIERIALGVEKAIQADDEYHIYRTLIGYEGIFVEWAEHKKNERHIEDEDRIRQQRVADFIGSIDSDNFPQWRSRIIAYSKTQSDDLATFPMFFHFLTKLAQERPQLAIGLVLEDGEELSDFLVPLLRGLWGSVEQSRVKERLEEWLAAGTHLEAIAKLFLEGAFIDNELLRSVLLKAQDLKRADIVALIMAVAAEHYSQDKSVLSRLFMPGLDFLSQRSDPQWIFQLWFRRQARTLISELDERGTELLLGSLLSLDKIDYHAEEILFLVAKREPEKILTFLTLRLSIEYADKKNHKNYDAVPYNLHKLNKPLAEIPAKVVSTVRKNYDGNYGMFVLRGGHLIKAIFPRITPDLEIELLKLVHHAEDADIEVVLGILRNYDGDACIHNLCKEILKGVPPDSSFRKEIGVALTNTGVVWGDYGFAVAYENKRNEIQAWTDDANDKVRSFAADFVDRVDRMIIEERKRADEELLLRKAAYGE